MNRSKFSEMISNFISQSRTDNLDRRVYKEYKENLGLKNVPIEIEAYFGQGHPVRVPFIAFLGPNQKPSKGIYPVILFDRESCLVLAYGVSEAIRPDIQWPESIATKYKTIEQIYEIQSSSESSSNCNCDLSIIAEKYGKSYLRKCYRLDNEGNLSRNDLDDLINDLEQMIDEYIGITDNLENQSSNNP